MEEEVREEHPAFAAVSLSRVSGHTRLHGSELWHQEYIALRVHQGSYQRHLSDDHYWSRNLVCEVYLSPAQFATLLTTMNVGSGVPGTFRFRADLPLADRFPKYEPREDTHMLHDRELQGYARKHVEALDSLRQQIRDARMSETQRKTLLGTLETARTQVTSNLKFVLDMYREKMEHVVTDAKANIEAFVTGTVQRTGLSALLQQKPELPESPRNRELEDGE